ncbi:MAG: MucBP domain-containing protein [Lachnospira sp.]|nr:MucBP domain-containing protein [Lachnospira sp.]
MNKKLKTLVATTLGVTVAALVAGVSQKYLDLSSNSVGTSKAYLKSLTANTCEATYGETNYLTNSKTLYIGELFGNLGKIYFDYCYDNYYCNYDYHNYAYDYTNDVGYYLVMPWANKTLPGTYKFYETTSASYTNYGYTYSFSRDIAQGEGKLSLAFNNPYQFNLNERVTYAEDQYVENFLYTNDFSNLTLGDTIITDRADSPMTVVERNGELALQVIYNNHSYVTYVKDINWYVIKKESGNQKWHVDGEPNWIDEGKIGATYTVKYVDATTGEEIEATTEVEEATDGSYLIYGKDVTATAKEISGYDLVSDPEQTITLTEGQDNVIVFTYQKHVATATNTGFYLVMPWANGAITDEDGYLKYEEKTGLSYRDLGYTNAFSSDLSNGDGTITLDFEYSENGKITYADESNIENLIDVDFSNLTDGTEVTTQVRGVNVKVVIENGVKTLQVTYNGDTYTTNLDDIKWYVIKKNAGGNWHIDGAAKWTKLENEEETVAEPETETESSTEVTEPESSTEETVVEPETETQTPETQAPTEVETEVTVPETESSTEVTEPETETQAPETQAPTEAETEVTVPETESSTEVTEPESSTKETVAEPETETQVPTEEETIVEVSSDEDIAEEPTIVEVAGDEDYVEIKTITITADNTYLGEIAADEDEVVVGSAMISTSTTKTSDNSNIFTYVIAMIIAAATAVVVTLRKKVSNR